MNYNDNFRKCSKSFSLNEFSSPKKSYSPIYSWIWNAPVTKEEIERQLDEFVRLGIKAFYIIPEPKTFRPTSMPTLLEPDYLTEPYFEAYAYALKSAFRCGMTAWIYDEGGWPSGGACGRVLLKHPELARRGLEKRSVNYKAGEVYTYNEDTASAFLPGGEFLNEGYVFSEDSEVNEYFSARYYFDYGSTTDYPDLLIPGSTEAFIDETFTGYDRTLARHFGTEITAVFSDEPCGPAPAPFRAELEEEYERRYGESIRAHLDVMYNNVQRLWKDLTDVTVPESSAQAMIRWYDLCSELFCKNYLKKEKLWANEHGMSFVGHLNGDDIPAGSVRSECYHIMRSLRNFDIPAVDVIWRQIFPGEQKAVDDIVTAENRFFPRYASSAAAQIGSDVSATESFSVYGQNLTYSEMRYVLGFQAIRGINIFNFMLKNYGSSGFLMAGIGPNFSEITRNKNELKNFNEYAERLAYTVSLGERLVNVALYFPICDIWSGSNTKTVCDGYEKAGFELEEDGVYFDIIDDDIFYDCDIAALESGIISIGKAKYDTVVLPPAKYIPSKVIKKLEKFIAGGGKVFAVRSNLSPEISGAIKVDNCKGIISSSVPLDFSSGNLRTYSKLLKNGRMDIVFNQGLLAQSVMLTASDKSPLLIDITRGKLRSLEAKDSKICFTLESGECAALLYSNDEFDAEDSLDLPNEIKLDRDYMFKKHTQLIIGDMTIYRKTFNDEPIPIKLGDWREALGEGFSGTCSYFTEFEKPKDATSNLLLDLGRVDYSAEVLLNGESVGILVMPPYKITLPLDSLKEKNQLEIRVSGSAANEYKHTSSFDKFAKWQLSPYHTKQMAFYEENLSGGLFGPVKILY